jgi:hypothetical protein
MFVTSSIQTIPTSLILSAKVYFGQHRGTSDVVEGVMRGYAVPMVPRRRTL